MLHEFCWFDNNGTYIYPGTVMIHSPTGWKDSNRSHHLIVFFFLHVQHLPNASFANATMMSARWPICFASCAYRPFVLIIVVVLARMQIGEIQTILWQGHGARITEHRLQMGHGQQEHHRVEQHNVNGSPSTAKHTNKHNQFIIHWLALIKCIDRIASTFPWSWSLTCSALSAW